MDGFGLPFDLESPLSPSSPGICLAYCTSNSSISSEMCDGTWEWIAFRTRPRRGLLPLEDQHDVRRIDRNVLQLEILDRQGHHPRRAGDEVELRDFVVAIV